MIRVLHVVNWLKRGGVETQLLWILRACDRSRFRMDVCCVGTEEGYLADEARASGAEILRCRKSANLIGFSRRFARLLAGSRRSGPPEVRPERTGGYDIVHAHLSGWAGPLMRGARSAGVPVRIAHMRNSDPLGSDAGRGRLERLARSIYARLGRHWIDAHATHVLGVSESSLDSRWPDWRRSPGRFAVWTLGVDTERFSPAPKAPEPGPVVITVGALRVCKNYALLLEVFARARAQVPGARLLAAGEGSSGELAQLVSERGLSGSVEMLGLRDDIPELLARSAVFLFASRTEGLPNVLLEAQAAGLPVVASDIPANREALCPEMHPFMFGLGDPEAGACALARLLRDRPLARSLGEAGRRFVVERFDARKGLARLQEMYETWVVSAREAGR